MNNSIDRSNYEGWFLDYHEGNLKAEQVAELFLFLQLHPELQREFDAFVDMKVTPTDELNFDNKESLKRDLITIGNFNYYLIGEIENNLSIDEKAKLNEFLKRNLELERDRLLYRHTILKEDIIVFKDKISLKKSVIRPLYDQWNFWAAAAAVVVFLLGILYIRKPKEDFKTAHNNSTIDSTIHLSENKAVQQKNNSNSIHIGDKSALQTAERKNDAVIEPPSKRKEKNIIQQPGAENLLANSTKGHLKKAFRPILNDKKTIEFKREKPLVDENIIFAERKEALSISRQIIELSPEKKQVELISVLNDYPAQQHRASFNEMVAGLADNAKEKINKITGGEILYSSDHKGERLPFKTRMIKLLAWTIDKVSGQRVQLKTDYDVDGNLAAYQLSAGKLSVERGF